MALGSTQPLTEMSTRNLPVGVNGGRRVMLTSPPSVSRFVSKPFSLPRPVIVMALPITDPVFMAHKEMVQELHLFYEYHLGFPSTFFPTYIFLAAFN
jgi:hypothetical protein